MISTAALAGRCTSMGPLEWGALLVGIGGVAAVPTLAAAVLTVAIHSVRNPATADSNASHQHRLPYGSRPPARRLGRYSCACSGPLFRAAADHASPLAHVLWTLHRTRSFFLGQQQVFPAFLRGSIFHTILAVMPFPLMTYWLIGIPFKGAYKIQSPPTPTPVPLSIL
jgi:hypothetical protein